MSSLSVPIGKLISYLHRQSQKVLVRDLLPYGIGSGGQHTFLKLILNTPGITQDQMTVETKFDKATTARSVKHLEEAGYIERRPDPADRRSSLLYPTAKAIAFKPTLQSVLDNLNIRLSTGLTEEEYAQLIALLQKVRQNVENV